jgi:hypothetical protein
VNIDFLIGLLRGVAAGALTAWLVIGYLIRRRRATYRIEDAHAWLRGIHNPDSQMQWATGIAAQIAGVPAQPFDRLCYAAHVVIARVREYEQRRAAEQAEYFRRMYAGMQNAYGHWHQTNQYRGRNPYA